MKKQLLAFFTILGLCEVGIVNATAFYIDEFTVTKIDGSVETTFFQDTFSDNVAPIDATTENPAPVDVNPKNRAYLLPFAQLPGLEAGGKLEMDTAEGRLNISPISKIGNLHQGARVNSDQSNTDASLWKDDQFVVEALFDLTLPQQTQERFGIRITDWTDSSKNEDIEISLLRRTDGETRILFRQANFVTNSFDLIQGWNPAGNNPNFGEFEQISMSLFNDPSNLDTFFASFTLFDTDNIFSDFSLTSNNTGLMFQVSDWIRPEFFVNRSFAVPEPMTILLLGLGLAGISYRRYSK